MKRTKEMQLGALLAALLVVSLIIVPAIGAQGVNDQKITGAVFPPEELKNLHSKYNITENDIKFAENKLPNFLEGTILYGNTRVIATETGKPPEGFKEGVDYDKVISIKEAIAFEESARQGYINKYGVDPANPKVEVVNGQPLPKEEVKKLVKSKKIDLKNGTDTEPLIGILGGPTTGPHAINGNIDVIIHVAKDSAHKPTEPITSDTTAALSRFNTNFGVTMSESWFWNYWDASDVSPATDAYAAHADLVQDTAWMRTQANDIVLGWAHDVNHNGLADLDGFFALAADTVVGNLDWPHDSIVQHEISHLFNAPDRGTWSWEHPECIMNYEWAYWGTNIWDTVDRGIVNENVWGS
ncbi:MAG: hypothetical protein FIB07_02125 [Candidatus Methanoperedens sp.]|nr:hypothetical protein [Candidatus Methanoperedens sp.]